MDGHVEIVKQLIDSLTVQLTNIVIKLESVHPILNRVIEEATEDRKISQETIELIKDLKDDIGRYHSEASSLPETIKQVNSMVNDVTEIKKMLVPVSKLCKFIMKPLGFVIFLLTSVGCVMGIIEAIQFLMGKAS